MQVEIRHEPERGQFIADFEETRSHLRYVLEAGVLDLRSTFVAPAVRGRLVGETLVKAALDYAQQNGYRVVPTCWFVETVVRRHERYRPLLIDG